MDKSNQRDFRQHGCCSKRPILLCCVPVNFDRSPTVQAHIHRCLKSRPVSHRPSHLVAIMVELAVISVELQPPFVVAMRFASYYGNSIANSSGSAHTTHLHCRHYYSPSMYVPQKCCSCSGTNDQSIFVTPKPPPLVNSFYNTLLFRIVWLLFRNYHFRSPQYIFAFMIFVLFNGTAWWLDPLLIRFLLQHCCTCIRNDPQVIRLFKGCSFTIFILSATHVQQHTRRHYHQDSPILRHLMMLMLTVCQPSSQPHWPQTKSANEQRIDVHVKTQNASHACMTMLLHTAPEI